ncbi:hypothetical protein GQ55_4G072600 [Panicum hallii var. hallii]|uniref:Leucine-rich repeat-containing N-terminal plant-type domain-containing protein n=1 Tax=Panicum hallii var. hallii TaxID=1504633 RepID=A0A2T7DW47_9POAL|nr:hypothetical protein GQ55_4G072600 [Panicum hallii var. hallii]
MGMEMKHFRITLLLSCCLAAAAAAGIGSSSDADAIADVARSLARPPSTWTAGGGDACSFKGVTCSPSGRVTAIDLAGQGLAGTLPSSLSSLTALESLQLQGNAFSGAVPPPRAPSLTRLSLEGNAFTSLPEDFLRATPALRSLSMDGLPLPPWPFPDAIFSCLPSTPSRPPTPASPAASRRRAHLQSYNHLQGPVPAFSPAVAADVVAGNGFCLDAPGPCDAQVSALLQVAEGFGYPLNLSRSWTGNDACSGWGVICDASEVTILGLTNYNLSGTMSPAIANLTGLRKLDLAGNRLTGEIPDALAALPTCRVLASLMSETTGSPASCPSFGHRLMCQQKETAQVWGVTMVQDKVVSTMALHNLQTPLLMPHRS